MKIGQVFYALQRKSDGMLMPGFKGRAGGTYIDPDKPDPGSTPRLFTTAKAAGDALRWWSKGHARVRAVPVNHPLDPVELDVDWSTDPVAGRSADDWEIIPVSLLITREVQA